MRIFDVGQIGTCCYRCIPAGKRFENHAISRAFVFQEINNMLPIFAPFLGTMIWVGGGSVGLLLVIIVVVLLLRK
jgi:hypothetical protein